MCGIAGEFNFDGLVDPKNIKRMTDAIIHRGPDDEGHFCEANIGLGHRRLAIIDLSPTGHQPMWTADHALAIVFNGEVYNYREIRVDLEELGYHFVGKSDTEVVINAIHCWGIDLALQRFIGMFAFALWDGKNKSLLLARDRLGVKPLFYQKTSKNLLFGSELKALYAHPKFDKNLSSKGLGQFFCAGYTFGETTVFNNTYKLPAGHYLKIKNNGDSTIERYWSIDKIKRGSYSGSYEEAQEQLISLCDSAFSYRLVSDVPVGVFLSGGIDSTYLSVFLKKRLGTNLNHLTIGFENQAFDETPKASEVAKDLDLNHTIKTIDADEARKALLDFVEIWDEPFGDTSGIPTSILCKFASEKLKVVLSADGGDELFCGYDSYQSYKSRFRILQNFPLSLRVLVSNILKQLPYKFFISKVLSMRDLTRWNPQTIARFEKVLDLLKVNKLYDLSRVMNEKGWNLSNVGKLINSDSQNIYSGTALNENPRGEGDDDLIDHLMRTDLAAFLGEDILTKVDRASMAASLECRDPFLDHRLVEFAFSLPIEYLYKDGSHKRILKQIIQPWISKSVLESPKRGFSIPLYEWLKGPWKPLVYEYLAPEKILHTGVLEPTEVKKELDSFYKYNGGRAEKIMLMLNFQMWAERWL